MFLPRGHPSLVSCAVAGYSLSRDLPLREKRGVVSTVSSQRSLSITGAKRVMDRKGIKQ